MIEEDSVSNELLNELKNYYDPLVYGLLYAALKEKPVSQLRNFLALSNNLKTDKVEPQTVSISLLHVFDAYCDNEISMQNILSYSGKHLSVFLAFYEWMSAKISNPAEIISYFNLLSSYYQEPEAQDQDAEIQKIISLFNTDPNRKFFFKVYEAYKDTAYKKGIIYLAKSIIHLNYYSIHTIQQLISTYSKEKFFAYIYIQAENQKNQNPSISPIDMEKFLEIFDLYIAKNKNLKTFLIEIGFFLRYKFSPSQIESIVLFDIDYVHIITTWLPFITHRIEAVLKMHKVVDNTSKFSAELITDLVVQENFADFIASDYIQIQTIRTILLMQSFSKAMSESYNALEQEDTSSTSIQENIRTTPKPQGLGKAIL